MSATSRTLSAVPSNRPARDSLLDCSSRPAKDQPLERSQLQHFVTDNQDRAHRLSRSCSDKVHRRGSRHGERACGGAPAPCGLRTLSGRGGSSRRRGSRSRRNRCAAPTGAGSAATDCNQIRRGRGVARRDRRRLALRRRAAVLRKARSVVHRERWDRSCTTRRDDARLTRLEVSRSRRAIHGQRLDSVGSAPWDPRERIRLKAARNDVPPTRPIAESCCRCRHRPNFRRRHRHRTRNQANATARTISA